jgi:hypothetical protein
MIVGKMLAIDTTSQDPSGLALQTKDTKLTSTLTRLGLSLALLSRDLLLVASSSVTDQEDLLETSVVSLRASDDKRVAVGKCMSLCSSKESFEGRIAATWWWGKHRSLNNGWIGGRAMAEHGMFRGTTKLLINGKLRINHRHIVFTGRRILRSCSEI